MITVAWKVYKSYVEIHANLSIPKNTLQPGSKLIAFLLGESN